METRAKRAVVCTLRDRAAAEALVDDLHRAGFPVDDISVVLKNPADARGFAHENKTREPDYLEHDVGAAGAVLGTFGVITGIISLGLPGPGWVIAAGPFAMAIAGFTAAAGGGFHRAMKELGIDHHHAGLYQDRLKAGAAIVAVHAQAPADRRRAVDLFEAAGAADISSTILHEEHEADEAPAPT